MFVMLNPSTADHREDDPTIRRCMNFVRNWGFARLDVVNLFGLRSTKPVALDHADDPVGPDNDQYIIDNAVYCARVIVAWGALGGKSPRAREVLKLLDGYTLRCLGTTKDGHPRHPLYVKNSAAPVPYYPEE